MRTSFHHKMLNNYFGDPSVFVRVLGEKRALQFDAGDINALSAAEIYKITDVFVTHTHIDHFIGFDTILRAVLRRELPLNVYGPSNISACVEGKLKGYSWNLIRDYPTVINVFAYAGRKITHSAFAAKNNFRRDIIGRTDSDGLLLSTPLFRVRTAGMDHGIPCLAYSIEEEFHINIDKDRLIKKGLEVGPWLTDFKKILRERPESKGILKVDGRPYKMEELLDLASFTKGQKISYATDIALTKRNIAALIRLAKDSDVFYCEAYFLEEDRELALERFHLTAKTAGMIAKEAGVKQLVPMHFSPRYSSCPEAVINEAMKEFRGAPAGPAN